MADVPAAVCDTHALLFHAGGGDRLGRRAAAHFEACERRQAILYVPAAVIWENVRESFISHSAWSTWIFPKTRLSR